VGTGDVPAGYDRVLVDAPCSGIGTLRRRPDLGTRKNPKNLADLAALQIDLLARAAGRVKEGGTVVYAVCSVLREEGEDVVRAVLERAPFLRPAPFAGEPARRLAGPRSALRVTPFEHQTDGYFLASFVRGLRPRPAGASPERGPTPDPGKSPTGDAGPSEPGGFGDSPPENVTEALPWNGSEGGSFEKTTGANHLGLDRDA
jgi:hypothetical protein